MLFGTEIFSDGVGMDFSLVFSMVFAVTTSFGCNDKSGSTSDTTQVAPKMKMTTPIPPSITTPDSVETRI